jgi:hypothetical protein
MMKEKVLKMAGWDLFPRVGKEHAGLAMSEWFIIWGIGLSVDISKWFQ